VSKIAQKVGEIGSVEQSVELGRSAIIVSPCRRVAVSQSSVGAGTMRGQVARREVEVGRSRWFVFKIRPGHVETKHRLSRRYLSVVGRGRDMTVFVRLSSGTPEVKRSVCAMVDWVRRSSSY
jgi:hypothetical protein